MINGFAYIDRGFRSKEEFDQMCKDAADEQHGVFSPTHPIRKGDKIVGWLSIAPPSTPFVFGWISTKHSSPRESFHIINSVENLVALGNATHIVFPVPKISPFYKVMEAMGYSKAEEYTLFIKQL